MFWSFYILTFYILNKTEVAYDLTIIVLAMVISNHS